RDPGSHHPDVTEPAVLQGPNFRGTRLRSQSQGRAGNHVAARQARCAARKAMGGTATDPDATAETASRSGRKAGQLKLAADRAPAEVYLEVTTSTRVSDR